MPLHGRSPLKGCPPLPEAQIGATLVYAIKLWILTEGEEKRRRGEERRGEERREEERGRAVVNVVLCGQIAIRGCARSPFRVQSMPVLFDCVVSIDVTVSAGGRLDIHE